MHYRSITRIPTEHTDKQYPVKSQGAFAPVNLNGITQMKLSIPDALLLHATLFSYTNSNVNITEDDFAELSDLRERIYDFIVDDDHDTHEIVDYANCSETSKPERSTVYDRESSEEDDLEDEDEDESLEIEEYITAKLADALSPIFVISPVGSKVSLEFEDVGDADSVDALLDEGSIIIDHIDSILLSKDKISLYDGEEWHDFKTKKIPKQWTKAFSRGKVTGFKGEEKE